jgi:hypothetical protein
LSQGICAEVGVRCEEEVLGAKRCRIWRCNANEVLGTMWCTRVVQRK